MIRFLIASSRNTNNRRRISFSEISGTFRSTFSGQLNVPSLPRLSFTTTTFDFSTDSTLVDDYILVTRIRASDEYFPE